MSGLFGTLNTANKGLMASQTALHTVGHNLSNANTEGYSRQRVDLKADRAFNFVGVGQLGTGVRMESIVRVVNDHANKQIIKENGTYQEYVTKSQGLQQLEIIFNEPSDTGLNFNLGEMFVSWQELSKNPESLNSKTIVVEKSKTLTDTIKHMASQLNSLKDETLDGIEKNTLDFNSIVEQLDSLNKQIFNITVKDHVPNDLLDQRDLMLGKLSSITDFQHKFDAYGRVEIEMGGQVVLKEDMNLKMVSDEEGEVYLVDLEFEGTIKNSDGEDYTLLEIKTGQIKGNQGSLEEVAKRKGELNNFAKTMADAINAVHSNDYLDEGVHGINFFSFGEPPVGSNYSELIQVADGILKDNSEVNVGKSSDSPEGDGSRALAIARLKDAKLDFINETDYEFNDDLSLKDQSDGINIEGFYRSMVTRTGISKQHSDNMVDNQEVLLNQLEFRRESTSGVSIDEEITNLIKFQSAFDANARVITVLSDMLDTLINRTGV